VTSLVTRRGRRSRQGVDSEYDFYSGARDLNPGLTVPNRRNDVSFRSPRVLQCPLYLISALVVTLLVLPYPADSGIA